MEGDAVGCYAQLFETFTPQISNLVHEWHYILPYRRFPSSQPNLRDALRDEKRGEVGYLRRRKEV